MEVHSRGGQQRCSVQVPSGGAQWRYTVEVHSRGAQQRCTVEVHIRGASYIIHHTSQRYNSLISPLKTQIQGLMQRWWLTLVRGDTNVRRHCGVTLEMSEGLIIGCSQVFNKMVWLQLLKTASSKQNLTFRFGGAIHKNISWLYGPENILVKRFI